MATNDSAIKAARAALNRGDLDEAERRVEALYRARGLPRPQLAVKAAPRKRTRQILVPGGECGSYFITEVEY